MTIKNQEANLKSKLAKVQIEFENKKTNDIRETIVIQLIARHQASIWKIDWAQTVRVNHQVEDTLVYLKKVKKNTFLT